ncbi:replication initiator [Luteococcus japonicus]|uniref:replication initiator n=1 Tax=Luteococcus japonicus TaxID=33984 RepID=UPI00319DFAD8
MQPKGAGPGLAPGYCSHKAHDREMLGLGGRRVLVSRKWSGKTLQQHRADRQAVVQAVLEEAGFTTPEIDRLAADTQMDDGSRRFTWENEPRKAHAYRLVMLESIRQRQEWRRSYHLAKGRIGLAEDQSPAPPPWASPQPPPPTSPVLQGAS